jgi:hypothetical protein
MADNIENNYNQRNPRSDSSSATGWILGGIIALAAIAAIWYYGMRGGDTTNVTVEQPATTAPATPPADTSTTTTTTDTDSTTITTTPPADTGTTTTATPPADTDTTTAAPPPADTAPAPEPITPPATNQ